MPSAESAATAETRLAELRERRAILELEREERLFESEERAARDELIAHRRGLGLNVESLAVRAVEHRNAAQRAASQQSHPAAEGFPLHESFSNYDWFDQSPYGFAGPGFAPVLGSGVGGMLNPISTRMDRRQGRMLPFLQTEQDLMLMRGVARIITTLNCPAQGVINALTNYVVGDKGFQFSVDKKHDHYSLPDGLLESVQDVLDEFEEDAHWADLQAELFMRSRRDGEYFLALHEMPGGKTKARVIEPEQITQTRSEVWTARRIREEHGQELFNAGGYGGQLDWYWGVLTPLRDVNDVLGFNSVWETEDGSSYYPAHAVQHFKLSDRNVKRGVSDFYPAFRMLQKAGNLAQKIVSGATVQAGIAYIRQHPPGRTQSDVMSWRANQADYTTSIANPFGGAGNTVYNQIRQDASILDVPNGQEYKYGPMGAPSGNQFIDVLQASLRWIATKWNMPEFLISGDASNSNFASTMVAESPFVKSVRFLQHRYGPRWVVVLWKVIEHAAAWGRFDRFGEYGDFHVLRRVLSISVDYPDVETRNRKEESDRRKQLCDDGMISPATRCAEEGYDYEKEVAKGARQRPAEISAKAAGVNAEGDVTSVASPSDNGGQAAQPNDGVEVHSENTAETAGAIQPSAMLGVNGYGPAAALADEQRRKLHESAADRDLRDAIVSAAEATDTEPSDKQRASGNYAKGKFRWRGLTIAIENPKGSIRSGVGRDGKEWSVKMPHHYGYVVGPAVKKKGADGDAIDVFMGPEPESDLLFVVDQKSPDGQFDEHKVLAGFRNEQEAKQAYLDAYQPGWKGLGAITPMTLPAFKEWLVAGDMSKPLALHESAAVYEMADETGREHDKKGLFTSKGKGGSASRADDAAANDLQMFSDSVEEGKTFDDVEDMRKKPRHKWAKAKCAEVDRQLGIKSTLVESIGDWTDGSEPSFIAQSSGNVTFERLQYAAAIKGMILKQKAVVAFKYDEGGPDAVYELDIQADPKHIRQILDANGIGDRTLTLHDGHVTVTIFDKGKKLKDKVIQVGQSYGDQVIRGQEFEGRGDSFGGKTRRAAIAEYKRIIDALEKTIPVGERYQDPHGRRIADYWRRSGQDVESHESTSYESAACRLARRAAEIWESGAIYP